MNIQSDFGQMRALLVAGLLLTAALGGGSPAFAQQGQNRASCPAFLPADATPVRSLHLCRSGSDGSMAAYACQDFVSGQERYQVMFKGGSNPRAIIRLAADGEVSEVVWSGTKKTEHPVCNLASPPQAPGANHFISAGVCTDDDGKSVPCAVFRRDSKYATLVTDYLVFYNADGRGPHHAIPMYVDTDPDAIPAELAFRTGMRLVKSSCCRHRGLQYLQYVAQISPNSTLYREALQQARAK
jgi:hypothetical protein